MRIRERLEPRFGYRLASMVASIRTFFYMRTMTVDLVVDGRKQTYRTPIVFIGVNERELRMPTLGNRVKGGKRCLHVMVVSSRAKARLLSLAWEAVRRGLDSAGRLPDLDTFMVDSCAISTRRSSVTIALDGEEVHMATPLEYRIEKDILRIVTKSADAPGGRGDHAKPD
jgi:hypothetical protein